jgi:hypothetical protein
MGMSAKIASFGTAGQLCARRIPVTRFTICGSAVVERRAKLAVAPNDAGQAALQRRHAEWRARPWPASMQTARLETTVGGSGQGASPRRRSQPEKAADRILLAVARA